MSLERYSRQILFKGLGRAGQQRLLQSRIAVIGCGALGTADAEMLARAGVGALVLVDRDFVEITNLHRQSLFTEEDVASGLPKAIVAERILRNVNKEISIKGFIADVTPDNIEDVCEGCSLIVDGTDNFETRYVVNDFSVKKGIPWVYGAVLGSFGTACAIVPGRTPCFRCLCEEPPSAGTVETCDTAGVIAPVVHVVAAFQVTQAMKIMTDADAADFRLLQADVWEDSWRTLDVRGMKREDCQCCGKRQFEFLEGDKHSRLTRLCGRNAVQVSPGKPLRLDFSEISERLSRAGDVDFNPYIMRIRVPNYEISLFPDGRSIIKGTEDFGEARAVYARYIGI